MESDARAKRTQQQRQQQLQQEAKLAGYLDDSVNMAVMLCDVGASPQAGLATLDSCRVHFANEAFLRLTGGSAVYQLCMV